MLDPEKWPFVEFEKFYSQLLEIIDKSREPCEFKEVPFWLGLLERGGEYGEIISGYLLALNDEYHALVSGWASLQITLPKDKQAVLEKLKTTAKDYYSKKTDVEFSIEAWSPDRDGWPECWQNDFAKDIKSLSYRDQIRHDINYLPRLTADVENAFIVTEQKRENERRVDKWLKLQNNSKGAEFVNHLIGTVDGFKAEIKEQTNKIE